MNRPCVRKNFSDFMEAKIIRVFPTKTNATPDDELVRIHEVPSLFDEADEVHISVAFTWDIPVGGSGPPDNGNELPR